MVSPDPGKVPQLKSKGLGVRPRNLGPHLPSALEASRTLSLSLSRHCHVPSSGSTTDTSVCCFETLAACSSRFKLSVSSGEVGPITSQVKLFGNLITTEGQEPEAGSLDL